MESKENTVRLFLQKKRKNKSMNVLDLSNCLLVKSVEL